MSPASVVRTLLAAAILAAFSTRAGAQAGAGHWVSIGPEGGKPVLALAVDPHSPSTVYAGCSGSRGCGVFKSVNGGSSWAPSGLYRRLPRRWRRLL